MADKIILGGIELGGTKTVFALGDESGALLERHTVPTREPAAVIADACEFFCNRPQPVAALGVGAFGPVVIDPSARDYGRILQTNKPGWSGFNLAEALACGLTAPIRLVTDVGAAAIGEARLGAAKDVDLAVYLTVGTGIGGAISCNGELLPALLHPEIGHITLERHPTDSSLSACAFHPNCAEGLAAGPAIMARFGCSLDRLDPASAGFGLIADYLGQLCCNLVLMLSPQRIVLGGGVTGAAGLIEAVQAAMIRRLGSYGPREAAQPGYLCSPQLGHNAGVVGALLCASKLASRHAKV